ncbi:eukaryotic translation initiation factor 2A [Chironomus tepperi]|uniref:eukaryotic translation initiation factor 2A n=1 Tax=Chironomus tepperi TaxID=113505 RepID=UPI00391F317D
MNFAVRSSSGVDIWEISNKDSLNASGRVFKPFFKEAKAARAVAYSSTSFAYGSNTEIKVFNLNYELKYTIPRSRSHIIKFSPKGTFLIVYEIFVSTKESTTNQNLFFYEADTGKELISFAMKKHSEWEPYISNDESVLALMLAGDVHFYDIANGNFTKSSQKLSGKIGSFSLSPGPTTHVALYLQSAKGSPSMARLFKYPNLDSSPIASKSFSQADKVEMIWNKKGNGCLIMTSTDVDNSGASYYGKQALHFLATNGDSYSVPLKGEGPIHNVGWSPKSNQFIVVYGYEPAHATLFNMKCDVVFDFGTGIRNCVYWNDFGNLVLFGAFGNLRGDIEVWDVNKKVQVSTSLATDTTLLEWAPSGDLYLTATTTPRLRQANGFKIWHYSGALLYELMWPDKQELYELTWQKYKEGFWKEPEVSAKKIEGIQSSQPQASAKKYVPPNIRLLGEEAANSSVQPPAQGPIPGLPPGYTSSAKPKKPANKPRNKPPQASQSNEGGAPQKPSSQPRQQQKPRQQSNQGQGTGDKPQSQPKADKPQSQPKADKPQSQNKVDKPQSVGKADKPQSQIKADKPQVPQLSEEDKKKVSAIKRKLKDIKILKEKQEKGEKLDKNQLKKVESEGELNKELAALKIS